MAYIISTICDYRPRVIVKLIVVLLIAGARSEWWELGSNKKSLNRAADESIPCSEMRSLSRSQRTLCERYRDHIEFVSEGAKEGIDECQWQFRANRWNCTTAENKKRNVDLNTSTLFGKVIDIGSRETAFTYAISAAGVVHKIARACKEGKLEACGCSNQARPKGLGAMWEWGGCGDNTDYAYGFAREFIDARERDVQSPRSPESRAKKAMNIHNNEVGRLAVVRAARPTCKCHGVSGSCSLNTCWLQVPGFREIGEKLEEKHNNAIEVKVTKRGELRKRKRSSPDVGMMDLVYLDSSPDYCSPNPRTGVLGTKGRECNKDSFGKDGCGFLCCGRGYDSFTVEIVERCNCKFQWCCVVKCQKCKKRVLKHICR
ncbi:protein Wnt-5-like [Styela clava]|uniref:protein Wnt-5-like n=1 Tax=Styela clava TaxID=7725 RepID=UPI001939E1B5|nr:protein Wnt-5-like [Styela clava]